MADAITTKSDLKIYEAEFQAGVWEGITQAINKFNLASVNTIRLVTQLMRGEYEKNAFFKLTSGLIAHRDTTSTSAVDSKKVTQDEHIAVKINRRVGPVQWTLDSIRKAGLTDQEFSFVLGQQVGEQKAQDMLNTGLLGLETALSGESGILYDATGETTKTLTTQYLVNGLAKMGDQAGRVVAWVMHSKPFFDLVGEQISANITGVANFAVANAMPVTLNRPVIITDAPALTDANGSATDTYNILGLTEDAVVIKETEQGPAVSDIKTGYDNLLVEFQSEHAFNLGVKGFKYDVPNGAANPTDATIATATNWDKIVTSDKDLAGVRILTQ